MAITVNWATKIVDSTADILDLPTFKETIRTEEDGATGILYDGIITYKRLDLGGGAYFHAVDFINGYQLRFPNAGAYTITGNLGATIIPVANVYVERKTSAAFVTTAIGGVGITADDVWNNPDLENGQTPIEVMRLLLSATTGLTAGSGTPNVTFSDHAHTKARITGTLDANGNRVIVALDPT